MEIQLTSIAQCTLILCLLLGFRLLPDLERRLSKLLRHAAPFGHPKLHHWTSLDEIAELTYDVIEILSKFTVAGGESAASKCPHEIFRVGLDDDLRDVFLVMFCCEGRVDLLESGDD